MPLAVLLALLSLLAFALPAVAQDAPSDEPPASGEAPAEPESEAPAGGMAGDAAMAAQMQQMQKALDAQLAQVTDPAQLEQMLAAMDARIADLPPEAGPMLAVFRKKVEARLAALQAGGEAGGPEAMDAESAEPVVTPEAQEALDTFMHAALIGRPDLVKSGLERLLAAEISASMLADMVDRRDLGARFERAVEACGAMEGVSSDAGRLQVKLEEGRLRLARDPARLRAAVAGLLGTMRQQGFAMRQLEAAGAFAVPPLLRALVDGGDSRMDLMAERAFRQIGRPAAVPLCEALPSLPPAKQAVVCALLGEIGSRTAAPWLASLAEGPSTPADVQEAAKSALSKLGVVNADPTALWTALARDYVVGGEGLLPYPDEPRQAMWSYDDDHGLMPTTYPTEAYRDRMAQRFAVEAMRRDPRNGVALSVFLAAALRLSGGEAGDDTAVRLVLAAGPGVAQQVLALAQQIQDPGLQVAAIRVLGRTAGSAGLVAGPQGGPLSAALDSPNRRVRIEAALTWVAAMPASSFPRSDRVVPVLASALRLGGRPSVAVLADQDEDRRLLGGWLKEVGFEVVAAEGSAAAMQSALTGRGTPDLVVVAGSPTLVNNQSRAIRSGALTGSSLLLLAVREEDQPLVDRSLREDRGVNLWFLGRDASTFRGAIDVLFNRVGGGVISGEESTRLVAASAAALSRVGEAGGGVFRMSDAEVDLTQAVATHQGGLRETVAGVLAWVPTQTAQRTLLDAGLEVDSEGQAAMLRAAAAHARRFGDRADPGQVDRLRVIMTGDLGDISTAAAECYGSLNLGPAQAIKLILK